MTLDRLLYDYMFRKDVSKIFKHVSNRVIRDIVTDLYGVPERARRYATVRIDELFQPARTRDEMFLQAEINARIINVIDNPSPMTLKELLRFESTHRLRLLSLLYDAGFPFCHDFKIDKYKSGDVVDLAKAIRRGLEFDKMPILADALEETGYDDSEVLNHLRHHKLFTKYGRVLQQLSRSYYVATDANDTENPASEE